MIDLRLGRVDIFGRVLIILQRTPAECDHPAGKAMYREHHPATPAVVYGAVIAFDRKTCLYQVLLRVSVFYSLPAKCLPLIGRVAQFKFLYRIVIETALF